jgi:hypothetical protein
MIKSCRYLHRQERRTLTQKIAYAVSRGKYVLSSIVTDEYKIGVKEKVMSYSHNQIVSHIETDTSAIFLPEKQVSTVQKKMLVIAPDLKLNGL